MLENYFPILVFIAIGLVMGAAMLVIGFGLGKLMGHARADSAISL
jgi:NADH-quinone oxidoreductase subunit A